MLSSFKSISEGSNTRSEPPLEEFVRRFLDQKGEVHFVKSSSEAIDEINSLISTKGRGPSCCSPTLFYGRLQDLSTKIKTTTLSFTEFQNSPREKARTLDVGITKAAWAVSETGSLLDISYSDEERLLSSISRVHIALLDDSTILTRLRDVAPKLRELLKPSYSTKPAITLIGGPSRTSDIELKSVLGVHGPHEVHVILCQQSRT